MASTVSSGTYSTHHSAEYCGSQCYPGQTRKNQDDTDNDLRVDPVPRVNSHRVGRRDTTEQSESESEWDLLQICKKTYWGSDVGTIGK